MRRDEQRVQIGEKKSNSTGNKKGGKLNHTPHIPYHVPQQSVRQQRARDPVLRGEGQKVASLCPGCGMGGEGMRRGTERVKVRNGGRWNEERNEMRRGNE